MSDDSLKNEAQVICSLQQKGGAGKTTMLCCLAGKLADNGANVLFLDTENKFPALNWLRGFDHPNITTCEIHTEEELPSTIEDQLANFDVILIDTAGWDSRMATYAVDCADLILIPSKSSRKDNEQAVRTYVHAKQLTKNKRKVPVIRIALWGIKKETNVAKRTQDEMRNAKVPLLTKATGLLSGFEQMDWSYKMPTGTAQSSLHIWYQGLVEEGLLNYHAKG